MSRAREATTLHVVADSLDQAIEDLGRSWAVSRRIGWAIDRGTPAPGADNLDAAKPPAIPPVLAATLAHARLVAEREAVAAVVPTDPGPAYSDAQGRVRRLETELAELDKGEGWGVWQGTEVGRAAADWSSAYRQWWGCSARAKTAGWREALKLRRQSDSAAEREIPLRERFAALAGPERTRLKVELGEAKAQLDVEGRYYAKPALPDQTPRGPAAPVPARRPDRHHRL